MRSNFSSIKENRLLAFAGGGPEQANAAEVAKVQESLEGKLENQEAIENVKNLKVEGADADAKKARETIAGSLAGVAQMEYNFLLEKYRSETDAQAKAEQEVRTDLGSADYSARFEDGKWIVEPMATNAEMAQLRDQSFKALSDSMKIEYRTLQLPQSGAQLTPEEALMEMQSRHANPHVEFSLDANKELVVQRVLSAEQLANVPADRQEVMKSAYREMPTDMKIVIERALQNPDQTRMLLVITEKIGGLRPEHLAQLKPVGVEGIRTPRSLPDGSPLRTMLEGMDQPTRDFLATFMMDLGRGAGVVDEAEGKAEETVEKSGTLSPEEQEKIKTEAEASVKDLDPTKMNQRDIDLTIARVMRNHGAGAHVEGNKFVIDPPKDSKEKSFNKFFGLIMFIVAFFQKKEAAPAAPTEPAGGAPKPPENAPQQPETPEQANKRSGITILQEMKDPSVLTAEGKSPDQKDPDGTIYNYKKGDESVYLLLQYREGKWQSADNNHPDNWFICDDAVGQVTAPPGADAATLERVQRWRAVMTKLSGGNAGKEQADKAVLEGQLKSFNEGNASAILSFKEGGGGELKTREEYSSAAVLLAKCEQVGIKNVQVLDDGTGVRIAAEELKPATLTALKKALEASTEISEEQYNRKILSALARALRTVDTKHTGEFSEKTTDAATMSTALANNFTSGNMEEFGFQIEDGTDLVEAGDWYNDNLLGDFIDGIRGPNPEGVLQKFANQQFEKSMSTWSETAQANVPKIAAALRKELLAIKRHFKKPGAAS